MIDRLDRRHLFVLLLFVVVGFGFVFGLIFRRSNSNLVVNLNHQA
jgi:hypothetical protein